MRISKVVYAVAGPASVARRASLAMLALTLATTVPATSLLAQGQQGPGHAGSSQTPTYQVCAANDPSCHHDGPASITVPNGGGGGASLPEGCTGDFTIGSRIRCTQVSADPAELAIAVPPGGTAAGSQNHTTLTVHYSDNPAGGCEKIYQVSVRRSIGPVSQEIANKPVASSGTCTFTTSVPVAPFLPQELQTCSAHPVKENLYVVLRSHNMWGNLTDDDGSDRQIPIQATVTCEKLTPSAAIAFPVAFNGTCPTGITPTASFTSNGSGAMTTTWTFGNGSIIHGTVDAKPGRNDIRLAPVHTTASQTTTFSVSVSGPGGVAAAQKAPYVVQCTPQRPNAAVLQGPPPVRAGPPVAQPIGSNPPHP